MKITKQHLKSLIKEEVELMKEQNLLNEQYDALLEKIEKMSFEELQEAILGRLAKKLGSAGLSMGKKAVDAATQKVKSVTSAAAAQAQKAKSELVKMYDEAKQEELKAILDQAREKAKKDISKTVTDFTRMAQQKGLPNPEEVLKIIWVEIFEALNDQQTVLPAPAGGIPQTKAGVGGSVAARTAE